MFFRPKWRPAKIRIPWPGGDSSLTGTCDGRLDKVIRTCTLQRVLDKLLQEVDTGVNSIYDQSAVAWGEYIDYDDDARCASSVSDSTFSWKLTGRD
jgi:hypothetical protein